MKLGVSILLFYMAFLPMILFGQRDINGSKQESPDYAPIITGPDTTCNNYSGYVYFTNPLMTDYVWYVTGGVITSGGTTTDYSATITWNTEGPQTVGVKYSGMTDPVILDVMVNHTFPVSITVTPSMNEICNGIPVIFTAAAENGGTIPDYHWFVNGVNVGANSSTYTYTPSNNDAVYCQVNSSLTCTSGNPASSSPVMMAVISGFPVSVQVSASANPSCEGNQVTFSATPFNGGNSPSFQWKHGVSDIPGETNSSYTYTPLNGDIIRCALTSSLSCTSGNPALSSEYTMTVSANQPVGVSISASANPVCAGNLVTFNATPVNGGSEPGYTWKINGIPSGSGSSAMTYSPAQADIVTCELNSNALCQTGNPATSNSISMRVEQFLPVSVIISASANPICNGSQVTLTATPTNAGNSPHYQWKVNGQYTGTDNSIFTYTPNNGEVVTCDITSSEGCATGNPATSNPITLTVSAAAGPSISISPSSNPTCAGTPILFTATPVNGGTNPVYQWIVNGAAVAGATNAVYIYPPANNDIVVCQMTSNSMCSQNTPVLSPEVKMMISEGLQVSLSIAASENPVCRNTTVVYKATPVNGGTPVYTWKVNGVHTGLNNATFSYAPSNGDVITCEMNSSLSCKIGNPAISNAITMDVVESVVADVSISASTNPACQNEVVTFTAASQNGGTNPTYRWRVNGTSSGTNSPVFSDIMTAGQKVTCELISSYTCAVDTAVTSDTITMSIQSNLTAKVKIASDKNPSCLGVPVTYSATTTGGGTEPAYQWKVNGVLSGSNSATFTYIPVNNDSITCELTSSIMCLITNPVTSNGIRQIVQPNLPPSVSIVVTANPVCTGTEVTFFATPVNGGNNPVYQWKRNGIAAGGSSVLKYTPANGDRITCVLTSNLMCVSSNQVPSNEITMEVSSALQTGISIATIPPNANPFCQGALVTYGSTTINGGNNPAYQWLVNGLLAGSGSTFAYVPVDGDFVTCKFTSDLSCADPISATSDPVYMVQKNDTPVSVSITASATSVCPGGDATFTAAPVNGGTNPTYQWVINGTNISGATNATCTYSPIYAGDVITCRVTSNATCASGNPASSNSITMETTTDPVLSVVISTLTNPYCPNTGVTFTSSVANGGITPAYQWKLNGAAVNGATNSTYTNVSATNYSVVCTVTSNAVCLAGKSADSDPVDVTASTPLPLGITVTPSSTHVCQGNSVKFIAVPENGGSKPVYQWSVNGTPKAGATNASYTYVPANNDGITCTVISNLACADPLQKTSDPPVIILVDTAKPVGFSIEASQNPVCQDTPVTLNTKDLVNQGTAPLFRWRVNGKLISGENNPAYTYIPLAGDVVTASMFSNETCVSGNPAISNTLPLIVNTAQPVSLTIGASDTIFCNGSKVIFNAMPVNGGAAPLYQWKLFGNPIIGATNSAYIHTPSNGDKISCTLFSNQSCILNTIAQSNIVTLKGTSFTMPVSIVVTSDKSYKGDSICKGEPVQFDATVINGGSNPHYTWKVNGVQVGGNLPSYIRYPNNNDVVVCSVISDLSCANPKTAASEPITMKVSSNAVNVSISASDSVSCQGAMVTYTATPQNQGSFPVYRWKVNDTIYQQGPNPVFTHIPVDGDVIKCRMTSNVECATQNPANSNTITQTVLSHITVRLTISPSINPVCHGTQVNFSTLPENAGSAPVYQWKINGLNAGTNAPFFSYIPENNDTVTCTMTSNAPCALQKIAVSNTVIMTVSPSVPVAIHVTPSANPVCQGSVTYSATTINGGSAPSFQWKVNGTDAGTNSPVFAYAPVDGDLVSCILTSSNAACPLGIPSTSNTDTLDVIPSSPVSITINPTTVPLPLCQGANVSYQATPVNGGDSATFQWMVNGFFVGNGTPSYTYIPNNGDVVECLLHSNAVCPTGNPAVSNPVSMNFQPFLAPGISIASSANPVCAGNSVNYTATPVNGGTNPAYKWQIGGTTVTGATNPTYSYTPVNNDVVLCVLTSDIPCPLTSNQVSSNSMTMSVLPLQTAYIAITTPTDTVCTGDSVAFTIDSISNPGSAPGYQWTVNGVPIGAGNSFKYIPADGDHVTCQLISSVSCITNNPVISNEVTMTVRSEFIVSIAITASPYPSCVSQPVTFTANAVNGGLNPEYRWKVNGYNVGGNSPAYTYIPTSGQEVWCEFKSGYTCASNPVQSNTVPMDVTSILQVGASIVCSSNPACTGNLVNFTVTPVNGGLSPGYQWKVNGIDRVGETNPTLVYPPASDDIVTCEVTSSEFCITGHKALSNPIKMNINSSFTTGVTVAVTDTMVCINQHVTFTATPIFGGNVPTYQWRMDGLDMPGATDAVFDFSSPLPIGKSQFDCVMQSSLTCAQELVYSDPINIYVLGIPVGVSIVANPDTAVCDGTMVNFKALPINGGPGPTYQWIVNGNQVGTNSPDFSYQPSHGDWVLCRLESNATCNTGHQANSDTIITLVKPGEPASISINASVNPFCPGTMVTYAATIINGGTTPLYQWQVNSLNVVGATNAVYSYVPNDNDIITCQLVSNAVCQNGVPVISTPITAIYGSPAVTFSACHDSVTSVNARPFKLRGGIPPGGVYSGSGVNPVTGVFTPSLAGQGSHNITYTYPPSGTCTGSTHFMINNLAVVPVTCGSDVIDIRDSKVYPTVMIGNQCWMAGNLNHGQMRNSTDPQVDNCINDKYCLHDDEANCGLYGGLYQWDELMAYDAFSAPQGLCPPGWHVPTDAEWRTLFKYYGGPSLAGDSLKNSAIGSFRAVMGGVLYQGQPWSFDTPEFSATIFWSADPATTGTVKSHGLTSKTGSVSDYHSGKGNGLAVRCLLD